MASTPVSTTAATSLPGQLIMVAQGLQAAELAYNETNAAVIGFTAVNNVTIDTDFEAGTISVTATLPITFAATANGVTATASDYL
jgi:hypothetical protein